MSVLNNAIRNMIARGVLRSVNDETGVQTNSVEIFADEAKDNCERFQNYGFTSYPAGDAEAIMVFPGGARSAGVIVALDDRATRMVGLLPGEVAMYNPGGRNFVIMHTDGKIEIQGPEDVTIKAKRLQVDVEEDVTVNAKEAVTVNAKSAAVTVEEAVTVVAPGGVLFDTPTLACTGDIVDNSGGNPRSVRGMRELYDIHTHGGVMRENSNTDDPNEKMGG
jgi:phage baseplate assembly protein V